MLFILKGVNPTENIIKQIVDIDAQAQQKLQEALELKEEYQRQLDEKISKTNQDLSRQQKERIAKILEIETDSAKAQKELIEQETNQTVKGLEATFDTHHEQLENEIFQSVIDSLL